MTEEEKVFSGGVAVITGAGSGIGRGIARRCGQIGMTVIVTDIDKASADRMAADIVAAGGEAESVRIDVSQPQELDALAQDVFDRHGAVRLLVNNAGIETVGCTWEVPVERWEKTLDVNIHGVIHGVRAFVPHMLRVGQEAWIGNLASVGAFGQMPSQTAYIVSKHAVQSFSECLYLEMQVAKAPINVSSIIPGPIRTGIFAAAHEEGAPADAARHRNLMANMLANHGMDPDEAGQIFVKGMAERKFWVLSHKDVTDQCVERRISFLEGQDAPALDQAQRDVLGI